VRFTTPELRERDHKPKSKYRIAIGDVLAPVVTVVARSKDKREGFVGEEDHAISKSAKSNSQ
jgi:hypothetical protein